LLASEEGLSQLFAQSLHCDNGLQIWRWWWCEESRGCVLFISLTPRSKHNWV